MDVIESKIEIYINHLGSDSLELRDLALDGLMQLGQKAVPSLIASLKNNNPTIRYFSAYILGKVGDYTAIEPLMLALRDESSDVRVGAVFALHFIGDERAIPELERIAKHDTNSGFGKLKLNEGALEAIQEILKRKNGIFSESTTLYKSRTVKFFFSYSHQDEKMLEQLKVHLAPLRHEGLIDEWHDRKILPGSAWKGQLDKHIETADVILLLISPNFINSGYCSDIEVKKALQLHLIGQSRVIPVLLRLTDGWENLKVEGFKLGELQAVPRDSKFIARFKPFEEGYFKVATELRVLVEQILASSS